MGRAVLAALALCGLCAGCENTPFYRADTRTWFGPETSSAPSAPEAKPAAASSGTLAAAPGTAKGPAPTADPRAFLGE